MSDRHAHRQHKHYLRESEGGGQNEQNNVKKDEIDGVQEAAEEEEYGDQAEARAAEKEHRDQEDRNR